MNKVDRSSMTLMALLVIALPLRMQELFPIMILFSAFTKPNEKGTRVKMK